MRDEESLAKPLDVRLYTGTKSSAPLEYSYNYLRGLVHKHTDKCWKCWFLDSCNSKSRMLKCPKISHVIENLKQKGLL